VKATTKIGRDSGVQTWLAGIMARMVPACGQVNIRIFRHLDRNGYSAARIVQGLSGGLSCPGQTCSAGTIAN
jgi:hypothetical protein